MSGAENGAERGAKLPERERSGERTGKIIVERERSVEQWVKKRERIGERQTENKYGDKILRT